LIKIWRDKRGPEKYHAPKAAPSKGLVSDEFIQFLIENQIDYDERFI